MLWQTPSFFFKWWRLFWLAESCLYGQELCKTGSSPSVNNEFLQEISNRQKEVLMDCSMNRFVSSSVTCCLLLEECVDMRKELCYLSFTDGQCSQPMTNEQTRMLCCCSMGQAWGHPCQPCPADKTSESLPIRLISIRVSKTRIYFILYAFLPSYRVRQWNWKIYKNIQNVSYYYLIIFFTKI